MLVDFFVVLACVYIYAELYRFFNELNKRIKDGAVPEEYAIRYDGGVQKALFVLFAISGISFLFNIMIASLYFLGEDKLLGGISLILIVFFLINIIVSMTKYVVANSYLKDFKRAGLIVPDDARNYGFDSRNLVKINEATLPNGMAARDKKTVVFAGIYLIVFVILEVYNLICKFANPQYGSDLFGLFYLMCILDLLWLIISFVVYRQSDNTKYKNQSDDSRGKKNRPSYVAMTGVLLILIVITLVVKSTEVNLLKFMYITYSDNNLYVSDSLRSIIQSRYDDNVIPINMVSDMKTGFDFLTYPMPGDLAEDMLSYMGCSSYEELKNKIRLTYDEPRVMVWLDNGNVYVRIENVYVREPK